MNWIVAEGHGLGYIGGEMQAAGRDVALHHFLQARARRWGCRLR